MLVFPESVSRRSSGEVSKSMTEPIKAVIDIRTQPSVTITDTYTKQGKHLGSVCKTEEGRIVYEEGPSSSKDVCFFPDYKRELWLYWEENK